MNTNRYTSKKSQIKKMSSMTKAMYRYSVIKYMNFINKNAINFKIKQKLFIHSTPFINVKGQEITMPSLSPTMSEGKIVKWFKKEGDVISPGDVLCDIETDKAVVPMETDEEGILAKILITENSKSVSVGTLIALMVLEGEDWTKIELPSQTKSGSTVNIVSDPKIKQNVAHKIQISGIPIKMPSLSPTMKEGTIIKWHKKEGDVIAVGDLLCDIQTDKAVMSMETDEEGILAKILIPEDMKGVKVGTLIALIVNKNEDWKNVVVPQSVSVEKTLQSTSVLSSSEDLQSSVKRKDLKSYGPAVRSLLSIYQLDSNFIKATGRNNKLLKEDVLKYIEENKLQKKPPKRVSLPTSSLLSAPQLTAVSEKPKSNNVSKTVSVRISRIKKPFVDVELTNIRRTIAKRLTESKYNIPHAYGSVQCTVDNLLMLRKEMTYQGIKVSLNDYIIKATALALKACPRVNVIKENDEYKNSHTIDVAIAVATPCGLITPIIENAAEKRVTEIATNVKELAGRAKEGKLKPHEFQGGSFTISNLGMYGIKQFNAIINPPQAAILAVGCVFDRYGADKFTHSDIIFTLSYDRRALQEDEAAEFLDKLKVLVENPKCLIAENISIARSLSI